MRNFQNLQNIQNILKVYFGIHFEYFCLLTTLLCRKCDYKVIKLLNNSKFSKHLKSLMLSLNSSTEKTKKSS